MNRRHGNSRIPFKIDRKVKDGLVSQVVDGFRQAIRNGFYKAGDTLPTIRALAPRLGVSVRVTAEAVKALAAEVEYRLSLRGLTPLHTDGFATRSWQVVDYGTVMVHVFDKQTREFYNLDKLYKEPTPKANSEETV